MGESCYKKQPDWKNPRFVMGTEPDRATEIRKGNYVPLTKYTIGRDLPDLAVNFPT